MSSIYSSLPNPLGDLKEIQIEFGFLFNFFNSDKIKKKVDFGYSTRQTVEELTSELIKRQKSLRLFHFSGHSGVSGLYFKDAQFDDEHISRFFNTICGKESHIECVFLNGCENENIVRQLSNVPVVIGTKTKIEDKTAGKFTEDFFSALILGENTYGKAFELAKAARNEKAHIEDRTGAERGIRIPDQTKSLDEYFMVVHKQGFADRKFPFKRGKTNWTKYLLLFFVILVVSIGYLFRDTIFKRVGGYSCDMIRTQDGKCNLVIGDFATIPKMEDFNEWLYGNIRNAEFIKAYIHAINIETFDNVIYNKSVDQDSLPSYCNYDFNLTGRITSEGHGLRAEFDVFPHVSTMQSPDAFVYSVSSLGSLDTLITTLSEANAQPFVLYEMCVACAHKRNLPVLQKVLFDLAETFDSTGSSAMYQRLQYHLAEVNLRYSDTTAALTSLDRISKATGNDLALMAIERKTDLYFKSNDLWRVYQAQSQLHSAMQARVRTPGQFELNADPVQYAEAANRVLLTRAELVIEHPDGALREYKTAAVKDLEYLQRIKFLNRDYSREIKQLKTAQIRDERLIELRNPESAQLQLSGRVVAETGEVLSGAILTFGNLNRRTDANGRFDFGLLSRNEVTGKQLHISRRGFQDKTIEINEGALGKIILTALRTATPPENYRVNLQAVKISPTLYREVLSSLKSAGHPIDIQRTQNLDALPDKFSRVPTIVFYDEGNRERANTLARQMKEWTKQDFEVHLASGTLTREMPTRAVREDITIQWVKPN